MRKPEDFDKFYYKKVALGEGCGCAERVIDNHEFDRLALQGRLFAGPPRWLQRLVKLLRRSSDNR